MQLINSGLSCSYDVGNFEFLVNQSVIPKNDLFYTIGEDVLLKQMSLASPMMQGSWFCVQDNWVPSSQ